MITEAVFLGSDNEIILIIKIQDVDANGIPLINGDGVLKENGGTGEYTYTAIDFITSGVTSMELYIFGVTVTSATDRLNYFDGGKITLKLGDIDGVDIERLYGISIKVFDPLHPNGQVIVHPKMPSAVEVEVVNSEVYY